MASMSPFTQPCSREGERFSNHQPPTHKDILGLYNEFYEDILGVLPVTELKNT